MKLYTSTLSSFLLGFLSYYKTAALEVKQVSFDDPAAVDGSDSVDARDAKIFEQDGESCFIYSSENTFNITNITYDEWHIWQTCGVFSDNITNTLIAGSTIVDIDYEFADASGNGSKICYEEDLPGSGGVSVHLVTMPSGDVVELTNSSASDGDRNSMRCDVSRDGSTVVFQSDDDTLVNDGRQDGQDHVTLTDDEGVTFKRLVPDDMFNASESDNESKWGVLSGDGSIAAFHAHIDDEDASETAWETYLWRKEDDTLHKVTNLQGKECNRTLMFEKLVELYGITNLTAENLADETKLGNGQTQCASFAVQGELGGRGAGSIDVKDNPASISDDARFITFMAGFEQATMRGTNEEYTPVSTRNLFLYDSVLGIIWAITNEGPVDDKKVEDYCCSGASSSLQPGSCSTRNEYRQACCWQKPCWHPVVTNRISGDGSSIVFSSDLGPDTSQINMDWEIVHYHIPTGTKTMVTDTDDKDYDDFYPSISYDGEVVSWTSDFNPIANESITSNNQIFAAKLEMGCSRDVNSANYHPSPDVEVCCVWDSLPDTTPLDCDTIEIVEVELSFQGDPDEMKSLVAFSENSSSDDDDEWCAAYKMQIRTDVACSLAYPKDLITVSANSASCVGWTKDNIKVTLSIQGSEKALAEDLYDELVLQYNHTNSSLWTSYLTKTMNEEPAFIISMFPDCTLEPSSSPTQSPTVTSEGPPPPSSLTLITRLLETLLSLFEIILDLLGINSN